MAAVNFTIAVPATPIGVEVEAGNWSLADTTAMRNGTLQGAYLMLAARSLGLDCGPMSGFFADQVDRTFFPEGDWTVNFMVNLGYGDATNQFPRLPRLPFSTACRVL